MKILHTADWHLGKNLGLHKRTHEFAAFIEHLLNDVLPSERPDVVVIAGDVFDVPSPSIEAQELYFKFLVGASALGVPVIISAGNHDSPAFLKVHSPVLAALRIHIVTHGADDPLIPWHNKEGELSAIFLAVPYLRDGDVRTGSVGQSHDEREAQLRAGVAAHYAQWVARAQALRGAKEIPIIALGHIFMLGGVVQEKDGVRPPVGTLSHLDPLSLPEAIDYLALGHLHKAQTVGKRPHWRYSGTPLPMSFSEAKDSKSVCLVQFAGRKACVTLRELPRWQPFVSLKGNHDELAEALAELESVEEPVYVELLYSPGAPVELLRALQKRVSERSRHLHILHLKAIKETAAGGLALRPAGPALEELDPADIFAQRLEKSAHTAGEKQALSQLFGRILQRYNEGDAAPATESLS